MNADPKELIRMRRRVERRVRGKVLYMLHVGAAVLITGLAVFSGLMRFLSGYGSNGGYYGIVFPVIQFVLFFGFTVGTHTLVRWLNLFAERMRETEMERELQSAGYYGEVAKRKRDREAFARLSDDGELDYGDNNPEVQHSVSGRS